ncbi:NAD(P)-binding domain-containing protein [Nitratifractor salsuginis]|uniref:FAD-dependent pyridine nucleotide-disulfide oxidoreductase n=1 Tax=Nitratifractor salsuginis (strain DSM 16511 / JCM 12458 / E9I37-1) TaxID=749222 RepID=E6X3M2_NITSE|nr:NAD(P)-binding domain-containing protein [Nitratifractor salsuginis]ADV47361.1 FAD-dependent pyridine nucleotide-disulfide oxidoreductase [Nitratifractor salsuginis DSM 16511]
MSQEETIYDLIIIGGGPGGIGTAIEARALGIEKILLLEKSDNHSDTIRKFYKDNKRVDKDWQGQIVEMEGSIPFMDGTKESTLDFFDCLIDQHVIDSHFNCEVDKITKEEDGIFTVRAGCGEFRGRYIVIAIGRMGKPNKPSYKIPPSIRKKVNFNLDQCDKGEKILVVGGGDTATEYAVELAESNDVTLNYRREELTRPNPTNQKLIKEAFESGKVRPKLGVDIEGLENEHGKVKVHFKDGSEEVYDRVIYAIGGTTPVDFLKNANLQLDATGEPVFKENLETSVEGIYIAGDIAFKSGGSIAIALNHGYRIVQDIISQGKLKLNKQDISTVCQKK